MSMKTLIFTLALAVMATASFGKVVIDNFAEIGTSSSLGQVADPSDFDIFFPPMMPPVVVPIGPVDYMTDISKDNTVGPAGAAFAHRYMEIELLSPLVGDDDDRRIEGRVSTGSGTARFAQPDGSTGDFFLRYGVDASGVPTVAEQLDSNFNLGDGGDPQPFRRINALITADQPGTLSITLIEDIDGAATTATVTHAFPADVGVEQEIRFFDFQFLAEDPGFTFSGIDAILVELNGSEAGDYTLSLIEAIPEPASASLLVLGAVGLMGRHCRQS